MPTHTHRWSACEVRELQDESRAWPRFELMAGELLVTPAPGVAHQLAVGELFLLLSAYAKSADIGVALTSPADIELHPDTVAQPDVFVVPRVTGGASGQHRGWRAVSSLLLAVEVLSRGSSVRDRVAKREYYLSAGVPEYWVVDVDSRTVERWSAGRADSVVERAALEWQPAGASLPVSIDLPVLFHEISRKLREIGGA